MTEIAKKNDRKIQKRAKIQEKNDDKNKQKNDENTITKT